MTGPHQLHIEWGEKQKTSKPVRAATEAVQRACNVVFAKGEMLEEVRRTQGTLLKTSTCCSPMIVQVTNAVHLRYITARSNPVGGPMA
jgi:hypothetical protein